MKRPLLTILFLLIVASCASAQVTTQNARRIRSGTGAPSGACVVGPPYTDVYVRTSDHSVYECTGASTWTLVVGGGTPGTVTSIATTTPITGGTITTTGTIACATCVTSAASLTSNNLMIGGGLQASSTTTTGTGILTALGVNVGSAGAPVLFNGALGSPSSVGTLPAHTLGGTVSGGGNQINNVIIGTSTPLAGAFTSIAGTSMSITGQATITNSTGQAFNVAQSAANQYAQEIDNTAASAGTNFGLKVKAGSNASDDILRLQDKSGNEAFLVKGDKTVTVSSTIASYNGVTTAGNGVPAVVATSPAGLLAQTTAVGPVTVYTTPAADGIYEIFVYLSVYVTGTSGTITPTLGWTDADSNTAFSIAGNATGAISAATTTLINVGIKKVKASTNITLTTTFNTVVGTPTYSVYVVVKKVG